MVAHRRVAWGAGGGAMGPLNNPAPLLSHKVLVAVVDEVWQDGIPHLVKGLLFNTHSKNQLSVLHI